mmetsp:Transcript_60660/g.109296  ORF Transcript_60660/g.109296 Transcript_60660/m.109296 type:complete len:261 (-) Transcript_60660:258-1040(-)
MVLGKGFLQGIEAGKQAHFCLALQEARRQHDAKLILLHRVLKGNRPTQDLRHFLEHVRHIRPSTALGIGAGRLKHSCVAAKFSEEQRLVVATKVVQHSLIGRVPEIHPLVLVKIILIAPGIHIETIGINGVVWTFELTGHVFCDDASVWSTHVHVCINQGHTSHTLSTRCLIAVNVTRQRLYAGVGSKAILIIYWQLICHHEHERVCILAELLHDQLGARQQVDAHVAVALQHFLVAVRARKSRQEPPVHPRQGHQDVDS